MALYVIADTHLSCGTEKPMDIFGVRWHNWTEKLTKNWTETVKEEDTVVIAGDISWAMNLQDAKEDFKLLNSLPGEKIIGKGNHDFWWNTLNKNEEFFKAEGITTVKHLYNNAYCVDDIAICGCRGWYSDEKTAPRNADYDKIVMREVGRLKRSLEAADAFGKEKRKVVFFHFPPVFGDFVCREIVDTLHQYGVKECYYGHIHGRYDLLPVTELEEISFTLVSADFLDFKPLKIS